MSGKWSVALSAAFALTALAVSPPVLAQPNAGALLNQQRRQRQRIPRQLPTPKAQLAPPAVKPGGATVVVKSIHFSGATDLVPAEKLRQVVAYAIGKRLDLAGLQTLARRVTDYLHAKGWLLANAYLPQQDVTQGNIHIAIRAGHLDGAHGKGTPFSTVKQGRLRIRRSRLEAIAAPLLPPGAVAKRGVVRAGLALSGAEPGLSALGRW